MQPMCDVLAEGSELGLGSDVVRGLELDDDAVGAAAMDIGSAVALIAGKAANLDVLLDDEDQSLQGIVNRAVFLINWVKNWIIF